MNKRWSKLSLFFLFIVAFIGTSLRATFFVHLPVEYAHLVHAHSHVAFQGWIYTLMFLLITTLYLTPEQIIKGNYRLQFKLTILIIMAILVAFSLQGYGLYSITASTLFQILNYWFIYSFFRDTKRASANKYSISLRFIRTGLWLGLLSTLAPWGIGILAAKGLNGSEAYRSFIYAFLHFQYNGWFFFTAIGLFFKLLERDNVHYNQNKALRFYWLFTIAVLPALTLSYLDFSFGEYLRLPAFISASTQIAGALLFYSMLKISLPTWIQKKNKWFQRLILIFLFSFFLKVILQLLSVFPIFGEYAFNNKNIILSYLHLSLIGVISFLLLSVLIEIKWLDINSYSKWGFTYFILGFGITEFILMFNGLALSSDQIILFIGSVSMVIGIFLLLINPQKNI